VRRVTCESRWHRGLKFLKPVLDVVKALRAGFLFSLSKVLVRRVAGAAARGGARGGARAAAGPQGGECGASDTFGIL
jgi:hypothetical protein